MRCPEGFIVKVKRKHGPVFVGRCIVRYVSWGVSWRVGKRFGFYNRPEFRQALNRALTVARHGDIMAVGRARRAPWGVFSHVAMVVETPWGKFLLHAYPKKVELCAESQFPTPGKITIVRVSVGDSIKAAAVAAAMRQLAKPFRTRNRKPGPIEPTTFSCVTLVSWAYLQAGIDLTEDIPLGHVVAPDDVISSQRCEVVFEYGSERSFAVPVPAPEAASVTSPWRTDPTSTPSIAFKAAPPQIAACASCTAPCYLGGVYRALPLRPHLSPVVGKSLTHPVPS